MTSGIACHNILSCITRSGIAHHNVPGFIQTILEGVFGLTLSILVPKRKWTFSQAELLLHEIF